jgi:hypothetical protein
VTPSTTYCTILARNYLPRALSLADSLRRHHPGAQLVVLLIDVARDDQLPDLPGVRAASTAILGLKERELLDVAARYDLVEFATAVKPLLLLALLEETDQVVYLDPDTYLTGPLAELDGALAESEGGFVLTPHYLEPIARHADAHGSEGHLLTVGFYNLGFCAVHRRARPFLEWWWSHLEDECLYDLLSGLFVDQKWVDVGAPLFGGSPLRHYGYNVGIINLHERPVDLDDEGYVIASSGDRLRLFHFHSFDPHAPGELSTRFDDSTSHLRAANDALDKLCEEYAEIMLRHLDGAPPAPPYVYATDTRGRPISRQLRRAFRHALKDPGAAPPSPYVPGEADAWDSWRRSARKQMARNLVGDAAKGVRSALPDEVHRIQNRFPRLSRRVRTRYVDDSGIWG